MMYMIVKIDNPFNIHGVTVTIKWIGDSHSKGMVVLNKFKKQEEQEEIDAYETNPNKYGLRNSQGVYLTVALNEIDAIPEHNDECEIELN